MKRLLFIRHAKSSWDSSTLKDIDRPLNERGNNDAPMMAKRLLSNKISIDAFVSSPAKRASSTAKFFQKTLNAPDESLIINPELYNAPVSAFYNVILTLNDNWKTVALFSHNPGITEMVNSLNIASVSHMPTCGIFGVHIKTDHWADFLDAEKQFWLFDYPKKV